MKMDFSKTSIFHLSKFIIDSPQKIIIMAYLFLTAAILCDVGATFALKASDEFKELFPSFLVVAGYIGAFYFMTLALRNLTLGTVYATWSGIGIILVALVGFAFYKEKLDWIAIVGMLLIVAGVVCMNLLSETNTQ